MARPGRTPTCIRPGQRAYLPAQCLCGKHRADMNSLPAPQVEADESRPARPAPKKMHPWRWVLTLVAIGCFFYAKAQLEQKSLCEQRGGSYLVRDSVRLHLPAGNPNAPDVTVRPPRRILRRFNRLSYSGDPAGRAGDSTASTRVEGRARVRPRATPARPPEAPAARHVRPRSRAARVSAAHGGS